jgi:hypothetical protein
VKDDNDGYGPYISGWTPLKHKAKDFAFTESEAIQFAEDLRKKKIASLKKQLARLESLAFTVI